MRALIAFAAAAAAIAAHADTLEVYRSVDAQGRVTFANVKPKHDDYDVMNVEYERQPLAPAAAPVAATPVPALHAPARRASRGVPAAPLPATLRVVAFPSLRLAATAGEPPATRRRKAAPLVAVALRMDAELRSWRGD